MGTRVDCGSVGHYDQLYIVDVSARFVSSRLWHISRIPVQLHAYTANFNEHI